MSDIEPQVVAKEFHFKEYDSLKTEIAALVEHSRKIEIYVVGAVAAFYAWYVVNNQCYSFAELWIPVLLSVAGLIRSGATLLRIIEIATYLLVLEAKYALNQDGLVGWETHREKRERKAKGGKPRLSPFTTTASILWAALVVGSLAVLYCTYIGMHPLCEP